MSEPKEETYGTPSKITQSAAPSQLHKVPSNDRKEHLDQLLSRPSSNATLQHAQRQTEKKDPFRYSTTSAERSYDDEPSTPITSVLGMTGSPSAGPELVAINSIKGHSVEEIQEADDALADAASELRHAFPQRNGYEADASIHETLPFLGGHAEQRRNELEYSVNQSLSRSASTYQQPVEDGDNGCGKGVLTCTKRWFVKTWIPLRALLSAYWYIFLLLPAVPAGFVVNFTGQNVLIIFAVNLVATLPLGSILTILTDEFILRSGGQLALMVVVTLG